MQDECCQGQRLLYLIYAKQFSCSVSEGNAQLFSVWMFYCSWCWMSGSRIQQGANKSQEIKEKLANLSMLWLETGHFPDNMPIVPLFMTNLIIINGKYHLDMFQTAQTVNSNTILTNLGVVTGDSDMNTFSIKTGARLVILFSIFHDVNFLAFQPLLLTVTVKTARKHQERDQGDSSSRFPSWAGSREGHSSYMVWI